MPTSNQKINIFTAVTAAIALTSNAAYAASAPEHCVITDKDGKNIIKAGMADCASGKHGCSKLNKAAEQGAWIHVPKGQCEKIKAGDFSGLAPKMAETIKAKLETKK